MLFSGFLNPRGALFMPVACRHLLVLFTVLLLTAGCGAARNTMPTAETLPEPASGPAPEPESTDLVETVEEFWPDGSLRIRRQVIRGADGSLVDHGVYARWHENGRPEYETIFDHGRKNGRAVRWHMNGEVWIEEFYELGLKEGACRTWNETGELVKEEQFTHGKPDGVWTVWKKGAVKARSCFDYGVPVDCDPPAAPE